MPGLGHTFGLPPEALTARELEIAKLRCEGLQVNEIAVRLGIKEPTVKTHLRMIHIKLRVKNAVGLVHALAHL